MTATGNPDPEISLLAAIFTYLTYFTFIVLGHIRDFVGAISGQSRYNKGLQKKGYATLFKSWESFFTRRMYHRLQDCWNRPVCSPPGAWISVMNRVTKDGNCTLQTDGSSTRCLNLGSYNYLGFADDWQENCKEEVMAAVDKWPISMSSSRMDAGTASVHEELEKTVARFLGKESAIVYTMGYGTNLSTIPALMGTGSLIISDSLNHTSIVSGARRSPSLIRVFRHNDPAHLEEILREAIVQGQPKHHRPWKKILVMVEGIYSMEGAICKLPQILSVCKKYKAYIYVDEAHSVGALGKSGRGICEYHNIDPNDIDILMGTFTKSFSGMGGYVAASKEIIAFLRTSAASSMYHNSMSPVVCQQVITAFKIIMGEDKTEVGVNKITSLRENSNFFRSEMVRLGLHVYGDTDSPIIPVLIYMPGKVAAFSRECLKRGVAVVVVGFPATSVVLSRARFCISAGHTREDIEMAVRVIDEVATLVGMKYERSPLGF
ncbi:pyridoxal phosphate-dependent transferase, partial [Ochromonadaceae sp. CCMP2298]